MKLFFTITIAVFLTTSLYSQKHFLDISGGVNVSKVSNFAAEQFKLGPAVGVGYEFRFARIMGLRTGLMYNQRGGKYQAYLIDNNLQEGYERFYPVKTEYISLPVLLGLVSTGETYGFGRFGAMVSYLLDATAEGPRHENGRYITETTNWKHRFNQVDVVGVIEGGVGGAVGDRMIIEGAVALQIGLSNAMKQSKFNNSGFNPDSNTIELPDNPHVGFSVMLAVKYRLGKNTGE